MLSSETLALIEKRIDNRRNGNKLSQADFDMVVAGSLGCDSEGKDYRYCTGVTCGGPLYWGFLKFLRNRVPDKNTKVIFLTEKVKVIHKLFTDAGYTEAVYLGINESEALNNIAGIYELLKAKGAFETETVLVDWGMEADLQYQLCEYCEELKANTWYYFAIRNTLKARHQVHGLHYETYAFDFYRNMALQWNLDSVLPVLRHFNEDARKKCREGIRDYVQAALHFSEVLDVEEAPENALFPIIMLVTKPTERDARNFPELKSVYEEAKSSGEEKYHLEAEESIKNYNRWLRHAVKSENPEALDYNPRFSVVVPVYNTKDDQLEAAIESVINQSYDNFELILVDDNSTWKNVRPMLKRYEDNEHVKVIYRSENGNISIATNDGIKAAEGEFIVFMDCDDMLSEDALYEVAKKLNENREYAFIYSDEDKITEDGKIRHLPFFKPEWSFDFALNVNYTSHLTVLRTSLVKEVGMLRTEYNGSQDYDLLLRCMEKIPSSKIGHIAKILYHWRERKESVAYAISAKNYAVEAAKRAKEAYLERNKIAARLEFVPVFCQYRLIYEVIGNPLVSIIIPSKDNPGMLERCIKSLKEFTDYDNYEVIVVDNGSNKNNKELISDMLEKYNAKYVYEQMDFNFSRMCNIGVDNAYGEYYLFLNDDIEVFQKDWLSRMLGQAQQPGVGAVGAKLYYPETTLMQHAGVTAAKEGPGHILGRQDDFAIQSIGINWSVLNCVAVTGACLLVSGSIFNEVGGFDENLPVAYNDVSLCMAIYSAGYRNVQRNDVVAYHYESFSRGDDTWSDEKYLRLTKERTRLFLKHPDIGQTDPYVNSNIHVYHPTLDFCERFDEVQLIDEVVGAKEATVYIDVITVNEGTLIQGWGYCGDKEKSVSSRFLLLKDPTGNIYKAPVNDVQRNDVVEYFDNDDRAYKYGFECYLNREIIRTDLLRYSLGMMITDSEGELYVGWSDRKTDLIKKPDTRVEYTIGKKLRSNMLYEADADIKWSIDNLSATEEGYLIRGFAFVYAEDHYRYRSSILLVDNKNEIREYFTAEEVRIDVGYTYVDIPFLSNSGFKCLVLKEELGNKHSYRVVIRIRDLFDDNAITDIDTGHRIEV